MEKYKRGEKIEEKKFDDKDKLSRRNHLLTERWYCIAYATNNCADEKKKMIPDK